MLGLVFEFIGALVLFVSNHIALTIFRRIKRKTFKEIMYDGKSILTIDQYSTGLKNRIIGIIFVALTIIIVNIAI